MYCCTWNSHTRACDQVQSERIAANAPPKAHAAESTPRNALRAVRRESGSAAVQVRAIRRGWLKPRAEREAEQAAPPVYMLWGEDGTAETARSGAGLAYIPAPKPELPGHEESYNPPAEYLPTAAEARALEAAAAEDDRTAFVPQSFDCLRKVPQYARGVHERFERCLDLYLCPRVRSKRVNYKPEDLVPKALPKPADLRPFPNHLAMTFRGHRSKARRCPNHHASTKAACILAAVLHRMAPLLQRHASIPCEQHEMEQAVNLCGLFRNGDPRIQQTAARG